MNYTTSWDINCMCDRPLRGNEFTAAYVSDSSAASVRDDRMQPFGHEILAIVGPHTRTTAAAIAYLLDGVDEGQVPK